jgi:hypothetical protein
VEIGKNKPGILGVKWEEVCDEWKILIANNANIKLKDVNYNCDNVVVRNINNIGFFF